VYPLEEFYIMTTLLLAAAGLFLGFLSLCEVAGYEAILAFCLGIAFTLCCLVLALVVGLQVGENAARKAKDKELAKKDQYPAIDEVCACFDI
jgi:hypothetical protein